MSVAIVSDNAVSTLASATGIGATSFTVPTGDGALFPSPGTLEHFLATIGPDEDNEVVRCTARSGDTVTCDALTATHAQGARVMVSPNKALFDELPRLIAVDLTLTVAPSGAMFATVPAALSWLKNKLIASDATVTIQIGDGTYSHAAPIVSDIPCADRVAIVGQNFYTRTFSSIQSGSGSAGNHLLVLNVSSTANVAVNDYVLIYSASGGTNPQYLSGCHKVTEVDSANSRITINSYHQAAVQPSGSTSGTLYVVKAILSFTGCDGMQSGAKWWKLVDKLAMVGNGAIDTAGAQSTRQACVRCGHRSSFRLMPEALAPPMSGSQTFVSAPMPNIRRRLRFIMYAYQSSRIAPCIRQEGPSTQTAARSAARSGLRLMRSMVAVAYLRRWAGDVSLAAFDPRATIGTAAMPTDTGITTSPAQHWSATATARLARRLIFRATSTH